MKILIKFSYRGRSHGAIGLLQQKSRIEQEEIYLHIFTSAEAAYKNRVSKKVGSVVEWLTHRTDDQHGLGSKPTCAILLCSWEKHFTALSPAWWS